MMDQIQSQILNNQNYVVWLNRPPPLPEQQQNPMMFQSSSQRPLFISGRTNWMGNKPDTRRNKDPISVSSATTSAYLGDSQSQNRAKARRFYPKKKFKSSRFAPFAPRNTTSFIIRAKKSGGIASLVSPCPVTPAILPTPIFSPSREVLVDMAKEEWGVDGYGSMKGLIRLRSPRDDDEEEEDDGGSSESDVEEHVEVERRLDHDLSRFEMIYPNSSVTRSEEQSIISSSVLENRVDDQDTHIAQLEEENLTLKERLFLLERDLDDLRRRVQCLETSGGGRLRLREVVRDGHEDEAASENGSDNEGIDDAWSEKSLV
ncbi:uncharacterized protein LOC107433667 [Ziziphus jujuba]|uniref:Uncharacterized protein LOC107433667 n=1 Tax=Ziziphus jujuba TaxID=326968 RepID=A0ABM3I205_ZIZJJ|nr:uncharacterized protein LOC107433667 [Ziziphus jujuba]